MDTNSAVIDTLSEQSRRHKRLDEIIGKGLPPFPHTVIELTAILSGPSPDLKKAAKLIRTDATLSAQLLRMCSSPLLGLRSRVVSIDQAATLLGADRLRALAVTASVVDFAGKSLPREQVARFWRHSFLAALLSEYLAKRNGYSEEEQAYIAGLLHDIGQVPQWLLACEEKSRKKDEPPEDWFDHPSLEREYFGLNHCEVGSRMAANWNFMPSFIDVLTNHHWPEQSEHDPYLVQIVGAAEHFLLTHVHAELGTGKLSEPPTAPLDSDTGSSQFAERTRQPYDDPEWQAMAADLELEYKRLLPIVENGLKSAIA